MDSMRSLNSSLPTAASPHKQPPELLLDSFKQTALAVTNLYKLASSNQASSKAAGYQDCLDELLAFLDKEDIGLSDGEGWRVRRWATQRLDGRAVSPNTMETDDEPVEKQDMGSSPEITRSHSASRLSPQHHRAASPPRAVSQPPPNIATPSQAEPVNTVPPQGSFNFRSTFPYPQGPLVSDIDLADLELSDNNNRAQNDLPYSSNPPITVSRPSRANSRQSNFPGRPNMRGGSLGLSRGAGQKRKLNISEFFDFSGSRDYRDGGKDGTGGGGGKRGRYA